MEDKNFQKGQGGNGREEAGQVVLRKVKKKGGAFLN